jgi:hypothetical protein
MVHDEERLVLGELERLLHSIDGTDYSHGPAGPANTTYLLAISRQTETYATYPFLLFLVLLQRRPTSHSDGDGRHHLMTTKKRKFSQYSTPSHCP